MAPVMDVTSTSCGRQHLAALSVLRVNSCKFKLYYVCLHAYMQAYIYTYMDMVDRMCIHKQICIQTCVYIKAYIHTYIHTRK